MNMRQATAQRVLGRRARHRRIRKKVRGVSERPRVCVYRSGKHTYAQIVDDFSEKTLLGISTLDKRLRKTGMDGIARAEALGKLIAEEGAKKGIKRVVFDRGGYLYHGRVKAFAEAIRAGGMQV